MFQFLCQNEFILFPIVVLNLNLTHFNVSFGQSYKKLQEAAADCGSV